MMSERACRRVDDPQEAGEVARAGRSAKGVLKRA
jgi:hypothetical protein